MAMEKISIQVAIMNEHIQLPQIQIFISLDPQKLTKLKLCNYVEIIPLNIDKNVAKKVPTAWLTRTKNVAFAILILLKYKLINRQQLQEKQVTESQYHLKGLSFPLYPCTDEDIAINDRDKGKQAPVELLLSDYHKLNPPQTRQLWLPALEGKIIFGPRTPKSYTLQSL